MCVCVCVSECVCVCVLALGVCVCVCAQCGLHALIGLCHVLIRVEDNEQVMMVVVWSVKILTQ